MARELRGILSAMCTPFTTDGGKIDEEALRDLVEGTVKAGVHGLVPCGSTGEFPALTTEERKRVTEIVTEQARGRVPVAPHVGSTSTAVAVELAKHAERVGADGVMAVNPFYEPMSLDEVYGYFKNLSDAVTIPIMIYNLPVATGMNLRPDFLARMAREIKNVKYVKDSSGDLSQVSELLYRYRQDVTVFNGWDTITFSGLALGSKGSVWGAVNVMPAECADLFNLIDSGHLGEARALWERMWPVMQFLVTEGYVASVKAGATLIGFRVGSPRPPIRALSPQKTGELKSLLIKAGALKEVTPLRG
ncbi:MAG TPA: 4-hydroxy-tetrahydrodipicolinate synthase [bacterium]